MWVIGVSSVSPSRSSSSAKLLVLMKAPVLTSRNAGLFFTGEKTCTGQFKQQHLTAAHMDLWNTVHFKRMLKTKVATKTANKTEFTKTKILTLPLPKAFELLVKINILLLFFCCSYSWYTRTFRIYIYIYIYGGFNALFRDNLVVPSHTKAQGHLIFELRVRTGAKISSSSQTRFLLGRLIHKTSDIESFTGRVTWRSSLSQIQEIRESVIVFIFKLRLWNSVRYSC